jgi:primosomal protein N'
MPGSPRMVPLYAARVADLRLGYFVGVICRRCGHIADLPVVLFRERLSRHEFAKNLGPQFRCRECRHKGANVDARGALGYDG